MPAFYRLLVLFGALSVSVLCSCDSSLDVGEDGRKQIPLDPADSTSRIVPDSLSFELYLKNGWDDSRRRLAPLSGSVQVSVDTTGSLPMLWVSVSYALDDTVKSNNNSTVLHLRQFTLRADSIAVDRTYQLAGNPSSGTGTCVGITRYNNGAFVDSLAIIPPNKPAQISSWANLSVAQAGGMSGSKKISGVYNFSAVLYDQPSGQVVPLPVEAVLSVYYR